MPPALAKKKTEQSEFSNGVDFAVFQAIQEIQTWSLGCSLP
jgi:hypothetical protein